ncbi:MAG TPA: DinB family protein [Thermomicrobiales bacterium]|nr:DinB family protein [Thermomicrobiales bacterium]
MSQRATDLAVRFKALNDEIIATVNACDDAAWNRVSAAEGWPVRVVAHHIAATHQAFASVVDALASEADPFADLSLREIDRGNAEQARANATVGKADTLAALRANGAVAERAIRNLSDAQLARATPLFDGRALTVEQAVDLFVIGHPAGHLASIRTTTGERAVAAAD